jgi:hypothetical protein
LNHCFADFCSEENCGGHFRQGAEGQGRISGRSGAIRRVHDAVLQAPGRGERLDQTASSRRVAQQQHASVEAAGPDTGLIPSAIFRKPALARYLDKLDSENPAQDDLYNLNPGGQLRLRHA